MFDKLIKNEKAIPIVLSLIVLLSRCLLIYYMDGPFIYADEMGYWTHAANMAGLQWSIDGTSWYSYGYSLILVPLFWISHNMSIVYKMALFLNAVMSVVSFLLCYSIAVQLAPRLERWVAGIISLIVIMYPSFLAQSYIAWTETEVFMLVWLLLWLVLKYEQQDEPERNDGSDKGWKRLGCAALIGLTCGYLYLVHNRTLGIMVACAMIVILMTVLKKMRWQDAGVILVLLAAVYVVNAPVKGALNAKASLHFIDVNSQGGNDISGGLSKMKKLMSVNGIQGFLYSLAGQLWYLTAATGLMFLWGIKAAFDKIVREKEHVLFYGFALLSLAGMVSISAISTIGIMKVDLSRRARLDPFFYGRYNECIIGIFLLLGLLCIAQAALNRKTVVCHGICTVLFLIMASGFAYKIKDADDYYVQSCNVFGTEYYRWFGEFRVGTCTVIAFVLSLLLLVGFCRKNDIRYRQAGTVLAGGICVLFFALTGLQGIRSFEMVEQRYTKQYAELFAYIEELDADQLYVYGSYKAAADVQNRTVDKEVIRLSDDFAQIDDVETGNYLVLTTEDAEAYGLEKLEVCYEYLDYLVCIK